MKNIKTFFQKLFSLTTWKRWLVLITTIGLVIGIASWQSSTYIKNNINKSIEFDGGANVLVQVTDLKGKEAKKEIVNNVSRSIFDRLTGGTGLNGTNVSIEGDGKILVSKNGIKTDEEKQKFEQEIIHKPSLSITDIHGNPLFYDGLFVKDGDLKNTKVSWSPPLLPGGAKARPSNQGDGKNEVIIDLKNEVAEVEWTKATDYIAKSSTPVILMWLNLKELIKLAETKYPQEWKRANYNPYNFVYYNEQPFPYKEMVNGKEQEFKPILKSADFDAKKYLISQANVAQALSGRSFVISGNFDIAEANELALNLNYGSAEYNLNLLSSNFIPASLGNEAFNQAIIASIVAVAVIALLMIINYGVLGFLTTISLGLYIFLTLLIFTVVRGEYSPATIAALVIGIGISVDSNILTFERLKNEIYGGNNLIKSNARANKLSISSIVDSNITTFLVAVILFYFGTKNIKGFAITMILSTIFTLVIMVLFTRLLSNLIVKIPLFQKHLWMLGISKKYANKLANSDFVPYLQRPNYLTIGKWSFIIPGLIVVVAIIVFIVFAATNSSMAAGIAKSIEFSGGTNIIIQPVNDNIDIIDPTKAEKIIKFLEEQGKIINDNDQIKAIPLNSANTSYAINISTTQDLINTIPTIEESVKFNFGSGLVFNTYSVSNLEAHNLAVNAVMAVSISLVAIVVYVLFRLKWTFLISAIIALIHDVLLTMAIFIIFRIEFSVIFIAAALSIVAYSINSTIVIFDRIKEIHKNSNYGTVLTYNNITNIANLAIRDTFKRTILTTLTTLATVVILMIFRKSTSLNFNIALFVGLILGTISSLFISTYIWIGLEYWRNKMKQKRIDVGFWQHQKPVEQTFMKINDYDQ